MSKIFVLGLPRTGTTSICSTLLSLNYCVAHTAYTQTTFDKANAIADTPIFNDYKALHQHYPNSKFIYLTRDAQKWLPSIKQLLLRMYNNVVRDDGGFNPIIKRCYTEIFSPFTLDNINNDDFLLTCYNTHKAAVTQYFEQQGHPVLFIDISKQGDYQKLLTFLNKEDNDPNTSNSDFPVLNQGGKVTAWKDLKHPLKVDSTKNGRCSTLNHIQ
ncbi:sulfotransferase family protein [Colwellia sp. RE-S-Sl-9]